MPFPHFCRIYLVYVSIIWKILCIDNGLWSYFSFRFLPHSPESIHFNQNFTPDTIGKITFFKVSNDLYVAKSNRQFSALIALKKTLTFSICHRGSLCLLYFLPFAPKITLLLTSLASVLYIPLCHCFLARVPGMPIPQSSDVSSLSVCSQLKPWL